MFLAYFIFGLLSNVFFTGVGVGCPIQSGRVGVCFCGAFTCCGVQGGWCVAVLLVW